MGAKKKVSKKLSLKGKRVLVTGGTGFVGSHVVDALINEKPSKIVVADYDYKKKLFNLKESLSKEPGLKVVKLDIASFKGLKELLKKYKFSVVFHLAALSLFESLTNPRRVVMKNIKGITNLVELQRLGFFDTLVAISSSEAYGSAVSVPMREETHPLRPTTPYAASKAAADLIAISYYMTFGCDISVIRPFNQYGPRHNPVFKGVVTSSIEALLSGRQPVVFGTGEQTRDYIYVKDTARGIIEAYKHIETRGRIVNLGTGKMIKIKDLVEKLIEISGQKVKIKFEKARVADVKKHSADISLAKKTMGWQPMTDFEEGLKETYLWFEKNLPAKM